MLICLIRCKTASAPRDRASRGNTRSVPARLWPAGARCL